VRRQPIRIGAGKVPVFTFRQKVAAANGRIVARPGYRRLDARSRARTSALSDKLSKSAGGAAFLRFAGGASETFTAARGLCGPRAGAVAQGFAGAVFLLCWLGKCSIVNLGELRRTDWFHDG
jgi:hypothetical protein